MSGSLLRSLLSVAALADATEPRRRHRINNVLMVFFSPFLCAALAEARALL
jgi:hypothetical protein